MLKLFTKQDIQEMINKNMTFNQIADEIGFEDIGQGYGYKSYDAWDISEKEIYDDLIVYIPEYCYSEHMIKQIDIESCYTRQDFENLCKNTSCEPEYLFASVDWQHPSSLLNELSNEE